MVRSLSIVKTTFRTPDSSWNTKSIRPLAEGEPVPNSRLTKHEQRITLNEGDICKVDHVWDVAGPTTRYALLSLLVYHEEDKRCVAVGMQDFKHLGTGKSYPRRYRVYDTFEQALIVTLSRGV